MSIAGLEELDSTVDDVHQADKGRQFSSRSNRVELGQVRYYYCNYSNLNR